MRSQSKVREREITEVGAELLTVTKDSVLGILPFMSKLFFLRDFAFSYVNHFAQDTHMTPDQIFCLRLILKFSCKKTFNLNIVLSHQI